MHNQNHLNSILKTYLLKIKDTVTDKITQDFVEETISRLEKGNSNATYEEVNAIMQAANDDKITSEKAQKILEIGRKKYDLLTFTKTWFKGGVRKLDVLLYKMNNNKE